MGNTQNFWRVRGLVGNPGHIKKLSMTIKVSKNKDHIKRVYKMETPTTESLAS